jgi:hypothetical protein
LNIMIKGEKTTKQTVSRRVFVKGVIGGTAGIMAGCWINLSMANASTPATMKDLSEGFLHPPDSARPWVYWFWINGNITKEGITADLEAMQRVGIGGVLIMEVDGNPQGPVAFGTDKWQEMFRFACVEAGRLGLEISMNDGAGWTGSGGPWNSPENSMQQVLFSELTLDGGKHFNDKLPRPTTRKKEGTWGDGTEGQAVPEAAQAEAGKETKEAEYYRDIAVIAFPTPKNTSYKTDNIRFKAGYETGSTPPVTTGGGIGGFQMLPINTSPAPQDALIDQDQVLDLTSQYRNGRLTWDVPPGNWTVLRFGHGSTGATNHPAPEAGLGLECDKMSKEAVEIHFNKFLGNILTLAGPLTGKTLVCTHVDSWEVGCQNWTKTFPEEFKKRCGYDIKPFLPAMTGRVIGSTEITERFLWDLRYTISELIAENYAGHLRELANKNGIQFSMEAFDGTPFDEIRVSGQSDMPQTEFWYRREGQPAGESGDYNKNIYRSYAWTPAMVSAAHIYGRKITPSEAFTANPGENWLAHPALMKPQGDWAFCAGINRFIFHRYALQPWIDRKPGMTMDFWGIHYERTQTWWEETKPWHEYIARCQYLLQKGLYVADILYMQAEGAPNRFKPPHVDFSDPVPPDPPGYNFDGCTSDVVFKRISINDGLIVLPDGMSYRIMVLPSPGEQPMAGVMTVRLAKKIEDLVNQGMIVVGPPPVKSPGLANYPKCEDELKQFVNRLWGDTTTPGERKVGKGRVCWGKTPQEVLSSIGIPLDFYCGNPASFRYIHRRAEDGSEIYFISNKHNAEVEAICSFRVSKRCPEFWWPETGQIEKPALYSEVNKVTSLPVRLPEFGSVFVVFRPDSLPEADRLIKVMRNGITIPGDLGSTIQIRRKDSKFENLISQAGQYTLLTHNNKEIKIKIDKIPEPVKIGGPWDVYFAKDWGAPPHVQFPELISWSDHTDQGVRYFSGKATYLKKFRIPDEMLRKDRLLFLDLGEVEVMVIVKLNGKDLGILWKKPFRLDITAAAHPGENSLELIVVNLWPNRLIGDANLPEDCTWLRGRGTGPGGAVLRVQQVLREYPQWLLEGKPSPAGRFTFSVIKVWSKDDPLQKSGLLGPVVLQSEAIIIS